MKTQMEKQRQQAVQLLVYLGLRRTSKAVRYLGVILPEAIESFPPGLELWTPAAEQFGQRTANVRCAVHAEIRRAYQRDPMRFSELVPEGDVLFTAPRSRDFIALAVKWLRRS